MELLSEETLQAAIGREKRRGIAMTTDAEHEAACMASELLAWRKLGKELRVGISSATCPDDCECKTCTVFRPLLAKLKELQG